MICNHLKVFSQNVQKNLLIVNTILETQTDFNIIFIQELPWSTICTIPSTSNCKDKNLVGTTYHPNWLSFTRTSSNQSDAPRVLVYINIRLLSLCFSLRNNIINHKDILLISFINNYVCSFIMNVYSDSFHSVLKYLKDTEVNVNNILIMTGNFNIRDSLQDPSFPYYFSISDNLIIIADSFDLNLLTLINSSPTRYSDIKREANSVIDLMFLHNGSTELNNHSIYPNWYLLSDHTPLMITIPIAKEFVTSSKLSILKRSKEEAVFIKETSVIISNLDTSNLTDNVKLENLVNLFGSRIKQVWEKNAKHTRITKHSKQWQNKKYNQVLNKYRTTRSIENWKTFKKLVKTTKRTFFDTKI